MGTCAALVLAGCGYPPRQHVVSTPGSTALFGLDAGSGGTSWDLVLPSPLASAAPAGAEAARRDAELSFDPVLPLSATREWPQAERPSLDRRVYVAVPRRAHTFIFFRERERRPAQQHHHYYEHGRRY